MKKNIIHQIVFFCLGLVFVGVAYGNSSSYIPQVYLQGYVGDNLLGRADIIAPIYLGTNSALFAYGEGYMSDAHNDDPALNHNPWTASAALGYRHIYKNSVLFGAYMFADYSNTPGNNTFWDLSPGIEVLGKTWDFRANGYFPISKKRWSSEGWASDYGDYSYLSYSGHDQYDQRVRYDNFEEIASGGDAEVGRTLFRTKRVLVKGYVGGYYFDMRDEHDITGISGRITVQPSDYVTFSINDTYDNYYHNTFMLSMRVRLNDLFSKHPATGITKDKDLHSRLLDPVERNLGTLATGSSLPSTHGTKELQGEGLEHDDIWFVEPGSFTATSAEAQGDGTYENPFTDFTPDTATYIENNYQQINAVTDPYPSLYFAPGTYSLNTFSTVNGAGRYALPYGWSMYGKDASYTEPAQGDDRALFVGGVDLLEGNNTLESIRVHNNAAQDVGIIIGQEYVDVAEPKTI